MGVLSEDIRELVTQTLEPDLFEFKVVELAPPGSALAQLQERD